MFRYLRLYLLESYARLTVFPLISVESRMELKQDYFRYLMSTAKPYVPLHDKVKRWKGNNSISMDNLMKCSSSVPSLSRSRSPCFESDRDVYIHHPHSSLVAPTVILIAATYARLDTADRLNCLSTIMTKLSIEAKQYEWDVDEDIFVVKGCATTRTSMVFKHSKMNAMDTFIRDNCNKHTVNWSRRQTTRKAEGGTNYLLTTI